MISSSGLRGVVGDHLSPDLISTFVRAYLAWLPDGKIIIGGDTRTSHSAITQLVSSICQLCGRDIVYIGKVPTPTVQQMVRHHVAAGGFAITASHNPVIWNGIKIIDSSGSFLSKESYDSFYDKYAKKQLAPLVGWDQQGGHIDDNKALSTHVDIISSVLPIDEIKPLRVLVDVNHGAGYPADQVLFERLNVTVDYLFNGADGEFSHPPEPTKDHLTVLQETMAKGGYDIGFAQDPDADRLVIVDENGRFIGEDYSLAFCMDYFLSNCTDKNQDVVVNLSTSKIIEYIAKKYNANIHYTRIGEPNVTAKMKALDAIIGGEGNGGVILPQVGWGRDSLTGICLALLHLSTANQTVSQIIASYPTFLMVREKQPLESSQLVAEKVQRVKDFFDGEDVNCEDGVKVSFDSSWVHLRPSNTEPIVRIFAEGASIAEAEELVAKVKSI